MPGAAARSLREHVAQALGQVVDGVRGGGRVEPAGPADRAAYVLLVHPQVEGSVAQQGLPVPADATEDPVRLGRSVGGRVGQQGGVPPGRRLADLVDQLVGGAVAACDDALLGVEPHQAAGVVGLADLDGLLGVARPARPRGGRCARRSRARPSRAGRSASTTARRAAPREASSGRRPPATRSRRTPRDAPGRSCSKPRRCAAALTRSARQDAIYRMPIPTAGAPVTRALLRDEVFAGFATRSSTARSHPVSSCATSSSPTGSA